MTIFLEAEAYIVPIETNANGTVVYDDAILNVAELRTAVKAVLESTNFIAKRLTITFS